MKKFINRIKKKYQEWKHKRRVKKRLAEVRKKDPFIYD